MNILDLKQGSSEWVEVRGKYRTASEASMVMDCHSNVSRAELLRMKATGSKQEFSDWVEKNILDKGYKIEALARPIVEERIGEELYPVTGIDDSEKYLASFDGLSLMEDTVWECKQWNEDKAREVAQQKIPICDYWQVVQQLMVSGADKAIYTVSDGTPENTISVEVLPKPSDFRQLIAAWDQFEDDLKNYSHVTIEEKPKGKSQVELPSLIVEITGSVSSSNLPVFKSQALAMIEAISTELATDEDFANAEQTVKALDAGEKELESVKARALAQTASIDELFKTIDSLKSEMRDKRLILTKLVKSEKDARRFEQIKRGQDAVSDHLAHLNEHLGRIKIPNYHFDFAGVIKSKKTMQSIHDAIDTGIALCKIEINKQCDLLKQNTAVMNELIGDYKFLFADANAIAFKETDDLIALIKTRIADHKEAEAQKMEAERLRIQQEEERKARLKIEAEQRQAEEARQRQAEFDRIQQQAQAQSEPVIGYVAEVKIVTDKTSTKPQASTVIEETVTITRSEYQRLIEAEEFLNALYAAGVDNWSGYDEAKEIFSNAA
jgi:predicted phage-related endonuclease